VIGSRAFVRARPLVSLAALLASSLANACGDSIEPASTLDRPRVVGAHVFVAEDPTRSSPRAGEHVVVDFFTASRALPRGAYATYALFACPSDPLNHSTTTCVGPQSGSFTGIATSDPTITLAAPSPSGEVMLFGIFCTSGTASFSTDGGESHAQCDGGAGQEVAVRVASGVDNLQPSLPADAITLDGAPFPADAPCAGGVPAAMHADGGSHQIGFATNLLGAEPEDTLVLEHLATHGALDSLYTAPAPGAGGGNATVKWTAPTDLEAPRVSARFHFVLRDGRGGTAFLIRTICIEKGEPT
jgi:hypothetical protein